MNPPNGEVMVSLGRGRGGWRPNQNVTELRRPQSSAAAASTPDTSPAAAAPDPSGSSSTSSISEQASPSPAVVKSRLSADAKEFVPRSFVQNASSDETQLENSATDSGSALSKQGQDSFDELSHEEWFSQHLLDVMKSLTMNPGRFDSLIEPLMEDLTPMLDNEEAVESILTVIIQQAIAERNFRYSGARLCNLLHNQCETGLQSLFRRVLLNKLMEEHEQFESNLENNSDRVYGFVHFLGELYIQLELKKGLGVRIAVLGDALLEALKIFIQIPSPENIKNTCESLKLAGRLLDVEHGEDMNSLFVDLQKLLGDARTGDRSQIMISNILKLRSENWGQGTNPESSNALPNFVKNKPIMPVWLNDGVNYGPDGQAITSEEYKFLYESCEDNETVSVGEDSTVWDPTVNEHENAEIMAAFREFINEKP